MKPEENSTLPYNVKLKVESLDPADIKVYREPSKEGENKLYPKTEIMIGMSGRGKLTLEDPRDIKIIFLDIDGVLNFAHLSRYLAESLDKKLILKSGRFNNLYNKYIRRKNPDFIMSKGGPLSKHCISLLNKLTDETGAKIVVSSTWRKDLHNPVEDTLKSAGVTGEIIGRTPQRRKYDSEGKRNLTMDKG